MKPFDLEQALQGKPLITRNRQKVQEFVFFNYEELREPILVKLEDRRIVLCYHRDGSYYDGEEHGNDLFMANEERWVNIYWRDEKVHNGKIYKTQEEAVKNIQSTDCITTVKLPSL